MFTIKKGYDFMYYGICKFCQKRRYNPELIIVGEKLAEFICECIKKKDGEIK